MNFRRKLYSIILAGGLFTGITSPALATPQETVPGTYLAPGSGSCPSTAIYPCFVPTSNANPLPVSGSFSASNFTPNGSVANLAVDSSGENVTLPTGASIAVVNTGSTAANIKLSVGAGSAATTDFSLTPGATVGLTVGANNHLNAITASGTTNLSIAGGTGVVSGFGGGGSSGGGGGAVTIADCANVSQGCVADSAYTGSGNTTEVGGLKGIYAAATAPLAACTVSGGVCVNVGGVSILPQTAGGLTMVRVMVANNTTSVAIKASAGQLFNIRAFSDPSAATALYIKLYNASQGSTTCGSGTPVATYEIPFATTGAGFTLQDVFGRPFTTAITACFTTGITDADTTAPAANKFVVNFEIK